MGYMPACLCIARYLRRASLHVQLGGGDALLAENCRHLVHFIAFHRSHQTIVVLVPVRVLTSIAVKCELYSVSSPFPHMHIHITEEFTELHSFSNWLTSAELNVLKSTMLMQNEPLMCCVAVSGLLHMGAEFYGVWEQTHSKLQADNQSVEIRDAAITQRIPTKCMEVHFSQRLILGECSWSLHRATENDATVPVHTNKSPQCTQPVSTKTDEETKADSLHGNAGPQPLAGGSRGFLHIPVWLTASGCRFIAAQQSGDGRKEAEGGRNGGGEAEGPALPALGPAQAGNCNSSSGVEVSSAWLSLPPSGFPPFKSVLCAESPSSPALGRVLCAHTASCLQIRASGLQLLHPNKWQGQADSVG